MIRRNDQNARAQDRRGFRRGGGAVVCWLILSGLLWFHTADAQLLRLVVLGDSLSAEYDSITGVAGVDDPTEYAAVTVPGWESMSWVEVVGRLRSNTVSLGSYGSDLLYWGPYRFSGYEYNFAIPGFTAAQFEQIVNSSIFSHAEYLTYKLQMTDTLHNEADAAVVWLGANEFRANYGAIYDGGDATALINGLSNSLAAVLDSVRAQKPSIKLVVMNLPDLGASPAKQAAHPDPVKRARVSAATSAANRAITNLAVARGIPVVDVFSRTYSLAIGETAWIGPVNLFPGTDPDNHPRYQFTRDGLHPNTCLQALIAQGVLDGFNVGYGTSIPHITDGEILNLVGLSPMQPYLDWVSTNAIGAGSVGDDPDVGSSRVDLQACKLEYSIVSPK